MCPVGKKMIHSEWSEFMAIRLKSRPYQGIKPAIMHQPQPMVSPEKVQGKCKGGLFQKRANRP
jgi:hypothetical protein